MSSKGTVVVIGSGAAGRGAARSLAATGWTVTVVDRDRIGGTCLWRGCIPKKALYIAARAARDASRAAQFGVECDVRLDWQQTLAWKWHAQETFAGDQRALLEARGIRVVEGEARFLSADELDVGGERMAPDHVVLASGSVPAMPDVAGIELADDSDAALRYPELPRSLAIVGGGFIAMELAGIFASLGTVVTVLERGPRVLSMLDSELAAVACARLRELGATVRTSSTFEAVRGSAGSLGVEISTDGVAEQVSCERAIVATGRRPMIDGLALDLAGVESDESGHIVVDAFLRTTNPRVWACGDAAGGMMQTPVANMEGATVARSIDSGSPTAPDCSAVPVTCFTTPQLASVGLTEDAAAAAGIPASAHRITSDSIGAAIVDDERDFLTKLVIAEGDGRILGAQVAGPTASDVIYAAAVAIRGGMTAEQLQGVLGVHPSYAESLYYAAW